MRRIAFIPIDNRPVCYTLPELIARCDSDLQLELPKREMLGDLQRTADISGIIEWLKNLEKVDVLILSLDTLCYGGLIPSRRGKETLGELKERLNVIKDLLKLKADKVYAVSSIMRISNNNVNEEEKEYWSDYGKKIFEYSFNTDKFGQFETDVPDEILKDYTDTRYRNFEINKTYLKWAEEGVFSHLIFSKDDCAEFGFNVREAKELEKLITGKGLPAMVKTGADEIPLSLLSRAIVEMNGNFGEEAPKISVKFLAPKCVDLISNYEDVSIKKSVEGQIELAGCKITDETPDLTLFVNNFETRQGEIVMNIDTEPFAGGFTVPETPYMIADVRFANGADNRFIEALFSNRLDINNFYGYSAWNTSANTVGSLICAALVRFFAKKFDVEAFKKVQFVRFADDWAYQANVRQVLKQEIKTPEIELLKQKMELFEWKINEILQTDLRPNYSYPWNRFFEVEIGVK